MAEPDYPVVMQVFDMLRTLQRCGRRGMAVNELAQRLGVHRRTVVRYLKALNASVDDASGAPIVHREVRGGCAWAVMPGRPGGLAANIYQYAAVFAATRHLPSASLLDESAQALLGRVQDDAELPADLLDRVRRGFCHVPFGPKDYGGDADRLDAVVRGILFRRPLDTRYRRPGAAEASERRLEPWTLLMYRDGLYLLARRTARDGPPRIYAVDRFERVDVVRGETFAVPEDFEPSRFFGSRLGLWQNGEAPQTVRLAFGALAGSVARERQWPGCVGWTEASDGRLILELCIPVTPEVLSWIGAWGPDLEVLEPPSLRAAVVERSRATIAAYQSSDRP